MNPRRFLFYVSCFLILLTSTASVQAQRTSIYALNAPSQATVGTDVRVTVSVDYSKSMSSYLLIIAVFDPDANEFVKGNAYSSPDNCLLLPAGTKYSDSAACGFNPRSTSGSESVTFNLRFSTAKTYRLSIAAVFLDTSLNVISESASAQSFSIIISGRFLLNVQTQDSVIVTVDGVASTPGSMGMYLPPGTHSISVPSIVLKDDSARLRFDHWSDGSTQSTRTLNLQVDTTLQAVYVTQYRLNLASPEVSAVGDGWYDSGSAATFSVPSSPPMKGIGGQLGGTWIFQGWYEGDRLTTASSIGSIPMDRSHTLTARWNQNYVLPLLILATIIVAAIALVHYRKKLPLLGIPSIKRRKRTKRRIKRTQTVSEQTLDQKTEEPPSVKETEKPASKKTEMFCIQCGAVIPRSSKFCKECGTKQP